MSSVLGIEEAKIVLTGDEMQKAQKVKTIGIAALILAIVGIVVPFIADIIAFFMAKYAMKIGREAVVPYDYEKWAYYAYRVSIVGILLWIVALIRILA